MTYVTQVATMIRAMFAEFNRHRGENYQILIRGTILDPEGHIKD